MPIGVSQAFHVNVNCSDLERSLAFYRDRLGLTASTHTRPESPQDGAAFRLDRAQWDAWILHDARGFGAGLVVDLLEWQVPRPTGSPNGAADLGFNRIGFYVPELDELYARLEADGVRGHGGPPHTTAVEGRAPVRTVVVDDPDGMLVELVEVGVDRAGATAAGGRGEPGCRVGFVAIGVSDLARSKAFYTEVLGFRPMFDRGPLRQPGDQLGLEGEIELAAAYLDDPRGTGACMLELVQMIDPAPQRAPAAAANQLGMFRFALLTDDIHRAHADLVARSVPCWTPPAALEMGPGVPPLEALMFEDPDGAVLELIQPSP
jgi:catechol 2,3-dioxygenase-like lactoylglutathione lyase family enzyme